MTDKSKGIEFADRRRKRVEKWLAENVQEYADVAKIALHSFEYDEEEHRGYFKVRFDEDECDRKFQFWLGNSDGYTEFCIPIFVSPYGVPSSFAAIEISSAVNKAMENAIRTLFPRMRPYGISRKTGTHTDSRTPFRDRIEDHDSHEAAIQNISETGFEILIELKD